MNALWLRIRGWLAILRRRWLLSLISVALIGVVALAFINPRLMISPGALMPAHAGLSTDCFACHAPLRGVSAQRCVSCHAVADIGLRTTTGKAIAGTTTLSFHQELIKQDCMACHSDHSSPRLVGERGVKPFSHELLRPAIRERCESCHQAPVNDLHRGLNTDCAQCHRPPAWTPATFEHEKYFLLDRDHNAPCATCHLGNVFSRYTCYGCHEHTVSNIERKHRKEGITDFKNCVTCHRSASEEPEHGRSGGREAAKSGEAGEAVTSGKPGNSGDRRERD